MALYRHILLAVGFSDYDAQLAAKARRLADDNAAQLSVIHVVENLFVGDATYGYDLAYVDLSEQLQASAEKRLQDLAQQWQVPLERCWVESGSPKFEIVRKAREQAVDLIVVGSQARNLIAEMLLGSTANGVLHHADCDVLAVRVQSST